LSYTDEEFVDLFERFGAAKTAMLLGLSERNIYGRRRAIEQRLGRPLVAPKFDQERTLGGYPMRRHLTLTDGVMIVGSDAHYEPSSESGSTAHRGMLKMIRELKPKAVLQNGDVGDFPSASKHDRIGWQKSPRLREEIEGIEIRLNEIEDAAGSSCSFWWNIGNHCIRFDSNLAKKSPEREGLIGSRLSDFFPKWDMGTSLWVNDDVVTKHRYKGGIHATHNNTVNAGRTIITGHLHSLKVTPFDDYNGTRWGVDTGTLNDPYAEHAHYAEDNPLNHRSGFIVLTFWKGRLLWPEIVNVIDKDRICFRGQVIEV
jgi:hypothetical protein